MKVGKGTAYTEVCYLVSADLDLGKWKQKNRCEFMKWHKGRKQQHRDNSGKEDYLRWLLAIQWSKMKLSKYQQDLLKCGRASRKNLGEPLLEPLN